MHMETTIKDRLLEYIAAKGIGQNRFSASIGVSPAYINNIVEGVKSSVLQRIKEAYPDINLEWLIVGTGSMTVNAERKEIVMDNIPVLPFEMYREANIDIKDYLDCGTDIVYKHQIPMLPKTDLYVTIQTDAMLPKYEAGDLVACRFVPSGVPIINGSTYFISVHGIGSLLRRVYDKGDVFELRAYDMENYTPFYVKKEDVMRILIVLGTLRINR